MICRYSAPPTAAESGGRSNVLRTAVMVHTVYTNYIECQAGPSSCLTAPARENETSSRHPTSNEPTPGSLKTPRRSSTDGLTYMLPLAGSSCSTPCCSAFLSCRERWRSSRLLTVGLHFAGITLPLWLGYSSVTLLGASLALGHTAVAVWLMARGFGEGAPSPRSGEGFAD